MTEYQSKYHFLEEEFENLFEGNTNVKLIYWMYFNENNDMSARDEDIIIEFHGPYTNDDEILITEHLNRKNIPHKLYYGSGHTINVRLIIE